MTLKGITYKKLISFFITSVIILCVMPFNHIKADTSTYIVMSDCNVEQRNNTFNVLSLNANSEVRMTVIKVFNDYHNVIVSEQSFKYRWLSTDSSACPEAAYNSETYSYNGVTYYYYDVNGSRAQFNAPISTEITNSSLVKNNAIYYTFGDGAIAPEPPEPPAPTYGQLKIGFTSSIAYSGGNSNAWRDNKDTIYFDRYDTLGNDLKGLNIELQAIPYTTEAASKQTLLGQKADEFIYDTVRVGSLGFYSPGQNSIDFTWEYITNRFSPTWFATYGDNWSLTGWYLSDHWYKVGWAYRARVVDDEMNTIIDWQMIYNGTSIDAQDTDNIINNSGYNPDLVNSINEINNFNNTTNNNYYNNQVINYNDGTLTSDGSWIEEFIRGIFETIGNLIDLLGGVFKEITDGIFSLIENLGVDILGIFTNLITWFTDLIGSIDLTGQNYLLPEEYTQSIQTLSSWSNGVLGILFNSGFGLIVLVPFILFIVGLFL